MNVPKIRLKGAYKILLLLLRLCTLNQLGNNIVNIQLLTAWEPLRFPVTLDHRDDSAELRRLSEAFNLFCLVNLNLIKVFIDDGDATLSHLDPLTLLLIVIAKLDPLSLWLRHLHTIDCFDSLQVA